MLVGTQVAADEWTKCANNKWNECRWALSIKILEVKTANEDTARQVWPTSRGCKCPALCGKNVRADHANNGRVTTSDTVPT
jgi:hypothetical protein